MRYLVFLKMPFKPLCVIEGTVRRPGEPWVFLSQACGVQRGSVSCCRAEEHLSQAQFVLKNKSLCLSVEEWKNVPAVWVFRDLLDVSTLCNWSFLITHAGNLVRQTQVSSGALKRPSMHPGILAMRHYFHRRHWFYWTLWLVVRMQLLFSTK